MVGGVEFVAGDVAIGDSHNLGIALHFERQFVVVLSTAVNRTCCKSKPSAFQ